MVYKLANELYPRMSLALKRFPASQLRGLSGAESDMRAMMAWHTDCSVHAGLHAVFKMSKQISPVYNTFRVWTYGIHFSTRYIVYFTQ